MKLTLKQLRVFDEVARSGSVSKAAERLNVTQSAASMSLRDLEGHLDSKIFHRSGKKLILNEYGRWLRHQVHDLLDRARHIEEGRQAGNLRGHLLVGASSTIANYLLPGLVTGFVEQHPDVAVDLSVDNSERIIDGLVSLSIDLGYIEGSCDNNTLRLTPWREDQLVILAAPHHALSSQRPIALSDLALHPWILREPGSGTREVFSRALQGKTEPLQVQLELGNSEAIKQSLKTGTALGCLSRLTVKGELERGELVEISVPELVLNRTLYMVTRIDAFRSPLIDEFVAHVMESPSVPSM